MSVNKKMRKCLAAVLAGALTVSVSLSALAADDLASAGQDTYISMHEYVSRTDMEDVYKVTLSVGGSLKQRNTEVVVLMDNSSSMNSDSMLTHIYGSLPGNDNAEGILGTTGTDDDYGAGYADPAYWLHPFSANYADIAKHRVNSLNIVGGFDGVSGTTPGTNSFGDPAGTVTTQTWPAGIHDYLQAMWGLEDMTTPGISETDFDYNWNPYATQYGATARTRLGASVAGVDYALDTFSDAKKNPGVSRTAFGMVTFSNPRDSFNSPYWDAPSVVFNAPGTFGFGEATTVAEYVASASAMVVPISTTGYQTAALSGIRYSTRMNPASSAFTYYQGRATAPGASPELVDYAALLNSRLATLANTDSKYPTAGASSQNAKGLIPMRNSTEVANLHDDMEFFVRAATMEDSGTWILNGLEEVEKIFWGATGATKNQMDASGNLDKPNRYVILLTDGDDTAGAGLKALQKINEMKNVGVQFMVVAIDSGANPATAGYDPKNLSSIVAHINANFATTNPATSLFTTDMTPWLALASIPIEAQITHPATGTQEWFEIGDIGTGSLISIPGTLGTDQLGSAGTWTAGSVGGYDFTTVPTLRQHATKDPAFAYIPANDTSKIEDVFKSFVDQIVKMGQGTKVDAKLGSYFDVYQMPGKPLFEVDGAMATSAEVIYSGGNINWRLINEIPLMGITTLSFYVKMDSSKANSALHYTVLEKAVLTSTGPFFHAIDNPMAPFKDIFITKAFSEVFVNPGGDIQQGSTEKDVTSDASKEAVGFSGYDNHQQARKDLATTREYTSGLVDVAPDIKAVKAATAANGRAKAVVEVANSANMLFQWQVQDETTGEWTDVFGATSSQYTLSSVFKVGETYKLRCKITNPVGKVSYSDVIEVKATAQKVSEGLQMK